jgi:NADH-quinone oxidoreductase subunit H
MLGAVLPRPALPASPAPLLPTWSPVDLLVDAGVAPFVAEYLLWPAIQLVVVFVAVLTVVAYLVYLERKVSDFSQSLPGPKRAGAGRLLQPLAETLVAREELVPTERAIFRLAASLAATAAFGILALVPFGAAWATVADVDVALLLVLGVGSVGVSSVVLAAWSSGANDALPAAIRSATQLASHQVAGGLALVGPLCFARSLSLGEIVEAQRFTGVWYVLFQPIAFAIFFAGSLAAAHRGVPDRREGESELVAGDHVERSGARSALFVVAEYANVLVLSAIAVTLFFGGWWMPGLETIASLLSGGAGVDSAAFSIAFSLLSILVFAAKLALFVYVVLWIRWTLPRARYEQLMSLGWRWTIPAALANILLTAGFFVFALEQKTASGQGWLAETDANGGLWVGIAGYAYFLVAAAITIALTWLLLAWINAGTGAFGLPAQRRLRSERRAR